MKKNLHLLLLTAAIWVILPRQVLAQVPQLFNYQGIARDAGGNVLPNRVIGVELSVLDGGPAGTAVYRETFTDTTNAFGLFGLQVGGGSVVSGTFAGINWATGNKYLQTAIDLTGGTNYTLSGTTQLLSVPYALYAQTAVVGVANAWGLNGNAGADDTAFIGTTDNSALLFRTESNLAGYVGNNNQNTFLGYLSGTNTPGVSGYPNGVGNTGIGAGSLASVLPSFGVSGSLNTAVGISTLSRNTTGNGNAAVGIGALNSNTTGNYNVAVGGSDGEDDIPYTLKTNVTGSYNTALGTSADVNMDGLSNATALGYGAIANASNKVRIGNAAVTVIEGQVPFTTPSDGRFKFNIREDVKGLDFILKLRPVTYQFNTKKEEDFMRGMASDGQPVVFNDAMMVRRTGFIAQEVEKAAQQSGYDFDGLKAPKTDRQYYSLSYASFVVPLVKAVQEQQGVIGEQGEVIERQEKQIDDLTKEVEELRQLILAAIKK